MLWLLELRDVAGNPWSEARIRLYTTSGLNGLGCRLIPRGGVDAKITWADLLPVFLKAAPGVSQALAS